MLRPQSMHRPPLLRSLGLGSLSSLGLGSLSQPRSPESRSIVYMNLWPHHHLTIEYGENGYSGEPEIPSCLV